MTTTFLDPSDPRAWVRLNILKSPHYADPRPEPLDACHHVFTFARRDFPLDFHIPGAEEEPISHEQAKQYAKDMYVGYDICSLMSANDQQCPGSEGGENVYLLHDSPGRAI